MKSLQFVPVANTELPAIVAEPLHDRWCLRVVSVGGDSTLVASGMTRKEACIAAVSALDEKAEYEVWGVPFTEEAE